MATLVNLNGGVEAIVDTLLARGFYKTKSEVIRAGVLELGRTYNLLGADLDKLAVKKMAEIDAEINAGKRKGTPLAVVLKKYGVKA